ncbi:Transcriptional regulator [Penicillium hispanicum]|uniref:Transcriptional regulator n=1 Tax=Penicillium hispanicum TaxID=1080232 RepID=UPI002541DD1E|nr:Transcriptional regulator [Penicillium hispanicum]KAJ5594187.1 Transcriptional regulator [Penicillium hispanicum]
MAPQYRLSDSESEAEVDARVTQSDSTLEQGLRDEVAAIFKSGKMEELTVKRVRLAAEKKLGLVEGFFKTEGDWKTRSDQIIKEEVEVRDNAKPNAEAEPAKKSSSAPSKPTKTAPSKRAKAEGAPKPRKRQKTQTPESEEDVLSEPSGDESDEVETKPRKRASEAGRKGPKPKTAKEDEFDEASVVPEEDSDTVKPAAKEPKDDSESEMSVVLDEEPKPAEKRQKSAESTAKKEKKKAAPKGKGKEEDVDPDQEEIKRLQGWLVKCGIRKMWWRELQPYETSKAKIKHLKQMLEEAGMKGRYSLEKARQIRDERELKADLEQIQQGAKQWGTGGEDEGSDGPPRRRAARGRQALAFLESDGEETD